MYLVCGIGVSVCVLYCLVTAFNSGLGPVEEIKGEYENWVA